jgi:hypothetical protein
MLVCEDIEVTHRDSLASIPAGCPDWPDFRTASIHGRIVDSSGAPVYGVAVTVLMA